MARFNKGIDIDNFCSGHLSEKLSIWRIPNERSIIQGIVHKCSTPMGSLNLKAFVGRSWAVCAVILTKVLE